MPRLQFRTEFSGTPEEVYRWHLAPGAFERLAPPFDYVRTVWASPGPLEEGARRLLEVGPLRQRWLAEHSDFIADQQFVDQQLRGPFRSWRHTHRFLPGSGPDRVVLEDDITYRLPIGFLTEPLTRYLVYRMFSRVFAFRHRRTERDLSRHRPFPRGKRVAITGASGLVGRQLWAYLSTAGHEVIRLVRREPRRGASEVRWDPEGDRTDLESLEGLDAIVHLAGKNIADGYWTASTMEAIRSSRVQGTDTLCRALAGLRRPPEVLVAASATGWYGSHRDTLLTEEAEAGRGFLAEVCRQWEASTEPARQAGIRVVNLRIGLVLSAQGGILAKLMTPFKLGLGAVVGGRQWLSWVSLDELIGMVEFALFRPELSGPVNAVAPRPVRMDEFCYTLGHVLRRPVALRFPLAPFEAALGPMAELLTTSQRILPERLERLGFQFLDGDLTRVLQTEVGAV